MLRLLRSSILCVFGWQNLMNANTRRLLVSLFIVFLCFPWRAFSASCLPSKLAKRVNAAGSVQGRLEQYVRIASRQNERLAVFLKFYHPWPEGGDPWQAAIDRNGDAMEIAECAWSEMRTELEAWSPSADAGARDRLTHLDTEVAKAYRSFQGAVAIGPGPFRYEIKSTREVIEDIQALLNSRINRRTR